MFDLSLYFGRDDFTDDVIIECSECVGKFRKCISVTYPLIRTVERNQSCETYHLIDGPEANTCKGAFDSLS